LDRLFSIAEKIATPLSLAALAALILFSLFRLIIQGLDLKTVLPAHVYGLLMRAMTYVFVLAICALVLGLLSYLATTVLADVVRSHRTDSFLRELGYPSLLRRIAAIEALAQIGRSDSINSQRICDSLAALVRHPPDANSFNEDPTEIAQDPARAMVAISDLTKAHLCKESDLQGSDLRGIELPNGSLVGAKLSGAKLDDANLAGADLTRADLSGVRLSEAVLRDAILREARLNEAVFYKTDLRKADLTSAKGLRGAALFDAFMEGAILDSVDLRGAKLPRARLQGASFRGADLTEMDLSSLRGICREALSQAKTQGARLPSYDC
jgi:uncharacterized protein YjbI with pentapeptide repeats